MLSGRNCFVLGAATLSLVVVNGCWTGTSSPDNTNLHTFGRAGTSTGGSTASAGAPAAGAPGAGAPAAGAPGGAGAGAGGIPGASGASTGGAGGAATAGAANGGGGAANGGAAGAATAGAGGAGACPAPSGTAHQATALDRSCWTATASDCVTNTNNNNPPFMALDASITTRFSTGLTMPKQTSPFTYEVNMGSAVMISGVKVDCTNAAGTDYALQLQVEVSSDHTTWQPVACGAGMVITDFSFTPVSAQYVRLTQTTSAATGGGSGWWSIYEFNVYGATANDKACTTPGTGPTGSTCAAMH